jgi:hypothetical protein
VHVEKLACGKAPGSDGIPNEVWKCINEEHKTILLETFNECWNTLSFPNEWSEIILCPIFKKGDKKNPSNYRPISLLNTGLKLYTMLISKRLNEWCEKNNKISDYQAAYRKKYGCEDHIFVLNAALQANISNKRRVYALFIDLSKAFDSIRHDRLWSKLYEIGLSSKFIANIQCVYRNAKAQIRTKFGQSDFFPLKNSVFQGETLSPKLFTLFIEDIVNILDRAGFSSIKIGKADINILLYADDMILLAYNVFDLQEKIKVLVNYFALNDLQVNLQKTKIIVIFRQGKCNFVKPRVYWGESEIEVVDSYTYLGVPLNEKMLYSKIADFFISKGKYAKRVLFSLYFKAKINNLDVRMTLFDSLVKSIVMYCYHVWGINFVDKLISFQMYFLRRPFRLPSYTPRRFLLIESCCKRIELSLVKNVLFFWLKIMCKPKDSLIVKCYDFLMENKDNSRMKFNWCRDMMNFLAAYECESLVKTKIDPSNESEILLFKCNAAKSLSVMNEKLSQRVLVKMQSSVKNPLYQNSRIFFRPDPLLNSNLNWNLVTLYVHMKALIPKITYKNRSMTLNSMNSYFNINKFCEVDSCTLCSLCNPETLFHVIFKCPSYTLARHSFNHIFAPASEEDFMLTICSISGDTLKLIYGFLGKVIETRDQWLNDYS